MSRPPAKRPRTLEGDPNQPIITRSSLLWFDDGSTVIQAEHTQFRVHRSLLSRHSSIFKDMFSVPQPPDSEELIEGCPIVHLSDSKEDVTYVLSALYDQAYTLTQSKILPVRVVAALLRLGSKYDFNHLRTEALVRLRSEFPIILEEWDSLPSEYAYIEDSDGCLFDIVNLAIEQGIISILPTAYYLCVTTHSTEEIFKGVTRADQSQAILPVEAQQACIIGREGILQQLSECTLAWLNDENASGLCFNTKRCAKARSNLIASIFRPVADPAYGLRKWVDLSRGQLCARCLESAAQMHGNGRQKMWDMLPKIFGFPPWDELSQQDR